ncbi:MAG: hypothetical protein IPM98_12325 [Lewinellaceae bacterium]|nr:hypothetical protein [Lewinellaceae bacterium]
MFNLLSIVIGIVFVLLLFSLLATTIMEIIAGLLTLRGKSLINVFKSMLGDEQAGAFVNHVYFKQMGEKASFLRFLRKAPLPPSYIRPNTFSGILLDVSGVNSDRDVQASIDRLPDGRLKEVLDFLYRESHGDLVVFRQKVEEWYNEVMERASEWYVSNVRGWLMGVGLVIAIVFNVDVISIYSTLSTNAALRDYVADAATQYVQTQPAPLVVDSVVVNPDLQGAKTRMETLLNENIAAIRSPLGIGWENVAWPTEDKNRWWMYKLIGWITTAFAVSLGAKFWYDLLRQLVNFRGSKPAATSAPAATGTTTTTAPILTKPGSGLFESTKRKAPEKKEEDDVKG